jgi:hypothetical protein
MFEPRVPTPALPKKKKWKKGRKGGREGENEKQLNFIVL